MSGTALVRKYRVKAIANEYEVERYLNTMESEGWSLLHAISVGDTHKVLFIHYRTERGRRESHQSDY